MNQQKREKRIFNTPPQLDADHEGVELDELGVESGDARTRNGERREKSFELSGLVMISATWSVVFMY